MQSIKQLCAISLILLVVTGVAVGAVYKRVDANGNVYFSDQPEAGAEEVKIQATTTFQPNIKPTPEAVKPVKDTRTKMAKRGRIKLTSPVQDQIVYTNVGEVTITFDTTSGDSVSSYQVVLDGVAHDVQGKSITLKDVSLGMHTVYVQQLVTGKTLKSETVSFSVLRFGGARR